MGKYCSYFSKVLNIFTVIPFFCYNFFSKQTHKNFIATSSCTCSCDIAEEYRKNSQASLLFKKKRSRQKVLAV